MNRRSAVHVGTAVMAAVLVAQAAGAAVWLASRPSPPHTNPQLEKILDIRDQFPPGYQVGQPRTVIITQDYLDAQNAPMAGATFIPAECGDQAASASLMPVGSTMEGMRGQKDDQLMTVAVMETPAAIEVSPVPPQCSAVAFVKPGHLSGFSTRVEAPAIDDAVTTQGLRISATVSDGANQPIDTVQYAYSALIDDRHVVAVTITGSTGPDRRGDIDPSAAQHLFVEAVKKLRQ